MTDFTKEDIEKACSDGFEKIRDWLYEDIQLVVEGGGNRLRHNLADIELCFKNIREDLEDGQLFSRAQVIEYLLKENDRLIEVGGAKELREVPMIFTQFAKALGVYQEMLAIQKQRKKMSGGELDPT